MTGSAAGAVEAAAGGNPWRAFGARQWGAVAAIGIGLVIACDALWVTDAEAIADECEALGAAMVARDMNAAIGHFHADFAWEGMDRANMKLGLATVSTLYPPTRATPDALTATFDGDVATTAVEWAVAGTVQGRSIPGTLSLVMGWRRTDDGWRITTLSADGKPPILEMFGGNRMPITRATLLDRALRGR